MDNKIVPETPDWNDTDLELVRRYHERVDNGTEESMIIRK